MNILEKKNKILNEPSERYCEIYMIKCLETNKNYIGQAVSHILNHSKYRPYGTKGRFKCHVSEAFSKKKNQCHYLNNAIRKYGVKKFKVMLIYYCSVSDADYFEKKFIKRFNTIYPNGYNLTHGGLSKIPTKESRKRTSRGVVKYYKNKKYERFMILKDIDDDYNQYIRPLNRYGKQYGWYIYIKGIKADFGGSHITLDESKKMCYEFLKCLKIKLAKRLVAGNSLES